MNRIGITTFLLSSSFFSAMIACALPPEGAIRPAAEVRDPRIVEASGIIASRRFPDHYYVHNDSGNPPLVFLIDRNGETRLTIALAGVENRDWEAISLAPARSLASTTSAPAEAPGSPVAKSDWQICIADIGDNQARHATVRLLCFPEPTALATDTTAPQQSITPAIFEWKYADGPVDAEGFIVNPHTGDGYILTKKPDGSSDVYKLASPWRRGEVQTAVKIGPLGQSAAGALTIVTDAAVSPDGRRLITRSYLSAWEHTLPGAADPRIAADFERLFTLDPERIDIPLELQGEAICYRADGLSVLTISEKLPTKLNETPTP